MAHATAQNLKIGKLQPNLKNVVLTAIVLDKSEPTKLRDERIFYNVVASDETGCVTLTLPDKFAAALRPGDIVRLLGGYTALQRGTMYLCLGRAGRLERIGEFTMVCNESVNVSKMKWDVKDSRD